MKKKVNFCFFIIIGLIIFSSFGVSAKKIVSNDCIYNEKNINNYISTSDISYGEIDSACNRNPKCQKDSSILGNVDCECSVAWLINEILNYLKILGPFLVLILSSIDFLKAIITSDDESLTKAQKSLVTRLILAAALFVLPELISVILNIFGITSGEVGIF